jgi:hypothetical protein
MSKSEKKKPLSIKKALEFMRGGKGQQKACLLQSGGTFYVVPGGFVDDRTARAIMKRRDVHGDKDGLWPGHDQTWRLE